MMQGNPRFGQSVVVIVIVVIGLMMAGTGSIVQADGQERSKVIPRDANAYGNSYGEWSAQWIQWALSIPAATNPVADTTGAHCGEGQAGPVWFLAGTFSGAAVTRNCNVPAGKALFFPLESGAFGAGVFDCEPTAPGVACNLATLRMAAAASMDAVTLEASLDGKPLDDLHDQRVQSPVLTLTYPPGAVVPGVAQGTYAPNVVDGYWLMLAPLRAGAHTLHFKSRVTGGVFAGTVVEVTYHLTVAP